MVAFFWWPFGIPMAAAVVCKKTALVFARWRRTTTTTSPGSSSCSGADNADDSIWRILRDDVRRMDHVELLCSILSCEGQDSELATWMLREEIGHIQHLSTNDHPAI